MSRSKKRIHKSNFIKRDVRKEKNRGFRRYVKLQIKAGKIDDLPDAPQRISVPLIIEE